MMITEDELRYYKQLDERMQRLFLGMKAKQLGRSCNNLKMNSYNVATHVAFDGVRKSHQVIENGLELIYSSLLTEMEKPVFPIEELRICDKMNLLEDYFNETE